MKNKLFQLLIVSSALLLSACGGNGGGDATTSTPDTPVVVDNVERIATDREVISLFGKDENGTFVGETEQIGTTILPRTEYATKLSFVSSDEKVASVDENGLVTAKGAGDAKITISSPAGKTSKEVIVHVADSSLSSRKANEVTSKIRAAQAATDFVQDDTILEQEKFLNTLYKDGEIVKQNYSDEYILASKSNAYFKVGGDDMEIKTQGGSKEFSYFEWVIYTNEYFDTYLFHTAGTTKTYMVVDTTSFIVGGTRLQALHAVLDNLFNSGHAIMDNVYEYGLGNSLLSGSTKKRGSLGEGNFMCDVEQGTTTTADYDDEKDYNIPYGTNYQLEVNLRAHWNNNYCDHRNIDQNFIYPKDGANYIDSYKVNYSFVREGLELDYPDTESYAKVDSIFDL